MQFNITISIYSKHSQLQGLNLRRGT